MNGLKKNHIGTTFSEEEGPKVSVIGKDLKCFLKNKNDLWKIISVDKKTNVLFEKFDQLFKLASNYELEDAEVILYENIAKEFFNEMKDLLTEKDIKNYEHILIKHSIDIIKKHKSLGKFSTQAWEHKNKIVKSDFQNATNKGGGKQRSEKDDYRYQILQSNYIKNVTLRGDNEVGLPYKKN